MDGQRACVRYVLSRCHKSGESGTLLWYGRAQRVYRLRNSWNGQSGSCPGQGSQAHYCGTGAHEAAGCGAAGAGRAAGLPAARRAGGRRVAAAARGGRERRALRRRCRAAGCRTLPGGALPFQASQCSLRYEQRCGGPVGYVRYSVQSARGAAGARQSTRAASRSAGTRAPGGPRRQNTLRPTRPVGAVARVWGVTGRGRGQDAGRLAALKAELRRGRPNLGLTL